MTMNLHLCPTCARSIPEGECAFCTPATGTTRLRVGYAVVAVVGAGFYACGGESACSFFSGPPGPVEDSGSDDVPTLASLDAARDASTSEDAESEAADGGDADAGEAAADATDE
ncbi:hypothetical protein BH09MYX1_BH09MYX1_42540 [soil metagenome]